MKRAIFSPYELAQAVAAKPRGLHLSEDLRLNYLVAAMWAGQSC